jgi:hypothetical protein
MGEVENASSWADMVRTIDHQRKNLPWDAQKQEPVQRFSTWEVGSRALLAVACHCSS